MSFKDFISRNDTTLGNDDSTMTYLTAGRSAVVLKAGMRLGRYHLTRFLGRGGFGEVWEAEDTAAGRSLALKILTQLRTSSTDLLIRFHREGQLAASLNHPRSVYVFRAEQIQGHPVIAMELMPGGTLQDQIHLRGRLPVEYSVDCVLDVIEGLQAAQEAGIVHRDVKPSNCFIDGDGRAKIGDFGISKSLEPPRSLTFDEAFVGTPAYASPEQVRGRDVDFRSDIYSIGATLYALLSAKPPFEGGNVGELLARILSEDAIPLADRHAVVPKKIERTIMRCMAKNREQRYPSYDALRQDLIPFSSASGVSAGKLANRVGAFAIDEAVLVFGISTILNIFGSGWPVEATFLLCQFVYFLLPEWLWGRSLGKYLTGLRVVSASGIDMRFGQALMRTMAFASIAMPMMLLEFRTGPILLLRFVTAATYLITMRRQNGLAGLHELLSGTRVISRSGVVISARPAVSRETPTVRVEEKSGRFGPYRALRDLWRSGSEALVLAFDDTLRRNVWLHLSPATSNCDGDITATRPGKLRWLHGGLVDSVRWNAYEALRGYSFCDWVRQNGRLSWSELRGLLLGVVDEISAKVAARKSGFAVSLRHIWVDHLGRPRILDFPAFIDNAEPLAEFTLDSNTAKFFVRQVIYFGLTGVPPVQQQLDMHPAVPLPEHARNFVTRVSRPGTAFPNIDEIASELKRLSSRSAEVQRSARLRMLIPTAVIPLLLVIVYAVAPLVETLRMAPWERELSRVPAYDRLLKSLEDYGDLPDLKEPKAAACKVLAWVGNEAAKTPAGRLGLVQLRPFERERVQSCAKLYPSVTEAEAMDSRAVLATCSCSDPRRRQNAPRVSQARVIIEQEIAQAQPLRRFERAMTLIFWAGGFLWVFPLVFSFLCPPGAGPSVFGLSVQTADGKNASRARCAIRSLFAWSPFVLFFPLLLATTYMGFSPVASSYWKTRGAAAATFLLEGYSGTLWTIEAVLAAMIVLGFAYSLAQPSRSLPDVLAGTYLVPK